MKNLNKFYKNIWNTWCEKVEKHNIPLNTYATYEEMWSPYEIFYPIILGILSGFFVALFVFMKYYVIAKAMQIFLIFFGVITIGSYLFLYLNWKAYDYVE